MIFFFLTLLIFASMEVVSKPLMGHFDPFVLTFWRFLLGFLFFLLYPGVKNRISEIIKFKKIEWISVFILGILNAFLAMGILQVGVKLSSAATAATVFCSNPIFVFIFAYMLGMEKFSYKKLLGLMLGVLSIGIIMSEKGFVIKEGVVYALFAAVLFAIYTVLSKKTVSKINPFTVNLASFFFGIIANLIFILIYNRDFFPEGQFFSDPWNSASFLYLGLIVTGVGYITFFETIKRLSALSASLIFLFKPSVAFILASIFLGETLSINFFAGMVSLVLATFLIKTDK